MSNKVLLLILLSFLCVQVYCVVTLSYVWPLTPLNMFSQSQSTRPPYVIQFLDHQLRPLTIQTGVATPFGPNRLYFHTQEYMKQNKNDAESLLSLHAERIRSVLNGHPIQKKISTIQLLDSHSGRQFNLRMKDQSADTDN